MEFLFGEDVSPEVFDEYRHAAEWCAKHGISGKPGSPLPDLMTREAVKYISQNQDEFEREVRLAAYAISIEKLKDKWV